MADTEGTTRLDKLGKYRIESILGKGAMGIVYKAFDTIIERHVALKTVRAELLAGDNAADLLARFKREVRAAGRCLHPNIVTIFEYGEDQGLPYIAMEYIQGQDLKRYLKEKTRLDVGTVLQIITQVLNALGYAHEQGIVHRDIKPGNVIVLTDGSVKVTDFGVARIDESSITRYGLVIGTPDYMAPEQFTGGPITPATDLYASGLVLFELLSGHKLFTGRTSTEIIKQVLYDTPRDKVELNPHVPVALQSVLYKALAKDPGERFQSAKEFSSALVATMVHIPREIAESGPTAGRNAPPSAGPALGEDLSLQSNKVQAGSDSLWAPEVLTEAEKQLTFFLGPVAKVMIKKATQEATDIEGFYQVLARHLNTESEKKLFLEKGRLLKEQFKQQKPAGTMASHPGTELSLSSLERVTQELIVYLGPIAKILVRKTAAQASSLEEMYKQLATHIPQESERAAFLKRCRSLSSS